MPTMNVCSVEIVTHTRGNSSIFRAAGKAGREDGALVVCYEQDGDSVELKLTERELFMRRMGESGLSARFVPKRSSVMRLKLGDSEGEIPLEVTDYSVIFTKFGCSANLSYFLLFSEEKQNFQLKIKIQFIPEGK